MDSEKTTTEHLDAQENLETPVQEDNIAPYEKEKWVDQEILNQVPEQENIPEETQEQPVQEEDIFKEVSVLDKILAITKEELDALDMSPYRDTQSKTGAPVEWFFGSAGDEHYRLLMKISTFFNGKTLYDIGTYQGSSALALAHNDSNFVLSFDIALNDIAPKLKKPNMNFMLGDVLNLDMAGVVSSPFIMLDTVHDGSYENRFYHMLKHNGFKGLLFLDDIYLNDAMRVFWDSITEPKYDLTSVGHFSGNGIVDFSKS